MNANQASSTLRICLTFDVDTVSIWLGAKDATAFSRGEFGVIGTKRILRLLNEQGLQGTFFVPGLTAQLFPDLVREIVAGGHELAHHGHNHESPANLTREQEAAVLAAGTEALEQVAGVRPTGWRSPAWYVSHNSLSLLVENGFSYDSSLMGHDLLPYRCRVGDSWSKDGEVSWGREVDLVELPVAWHLDDFPWFEYIPPGRGNLTPASQVLETWLGDFEYARRYEPAGVLTYTMHPQVIGRGHRMLMLEQLIEQIKGNGNVEFTTLQQAADQYRSQHPFSGQQS